MPRPRLPDAKINAILDYHRERLRLFALRRSLGVSGETIRRYGRLYDEGKITYQSRPTVAETLHYVPELREPVVRGQRV